jgi:hypothetical protein
LRGAEKLSDRALAAAIGAACFVAAAWPLVFVKVPPYQDLVGHLATVNVLAHPDRYPEYVATGFWKTNAALPAFCFYVRRWVGLYAAARLFVAGVLAAGAFALPRFVLHFGGRDKMLVASLVFWPMVHNWYVAMGMLNFALSIPCALVLFVLLDRQRAAPSAGRAAAAAAMACVTWYAHPFPVIVAGLLVLAYVASRGSARAAWAAGRALLLPLVPAGLLIALAFTRHVTTIGTPAVGATEHTEYAPTVWQLYNLWAHWLYGFTPLSASTLLVAAALAFWMVRRWREAPPLFGPWPTAALVASFALAPYMAFDWGYLGSRFVPFVWIAALTRVPGRIARPWAVALGAAALTYWVGNGVDVLRLDREQRELAAGVDVVPEGARVLFLNFSPRLTSRNTWSLTTAVGLYAIEKQTNVLDVWANSASQSIVRRYPPQRWEDPLELRRFLSAMRTRDGFCEAHADDGLDPALCAAEWRGEWSAFWRGASPEYPFVLMWDPTDDARSQLPVAYGAPLFHQGRLWIWRRP